MAGRQRRAPSGQRTALLAASLTFAGLTGAVGVAGCGSGQPGPFAAPTVAAPQPTVPPTTSLVPGPSATAPAALPVAEPKPAPPTGPRPLARKDGSPADAEISLGDAAFGKEQFDDAIAAYKRAMTLAPKDPAPLVGFVRARLAKDDVPTDFNSGADNRTLKGMLVELRKAVLLDGTYAPAQLELGRALLVLGQGSQAKAALDRALELDSSDPEAHSARGIAALSEGDIAAAERALARAAELDPGSAARHGNLGTIRMMVGKVPEAIRAYEMARKLAPQDPGVLNDLGTALLANNQSTNAIGVLEQAARLAPKSAQTAQNLGYAHHLAGDPKQAETHYLRAIELDPKLISAHINLGNLLAQQGKLADARRAYEKAQAVDATDPRVVAALADLSDLEKATPPKP